MEETNIDLGVQNVGSSIKTIPLQLFPMKFTFPVRNSSDSFYQALNLCSMLFDIKNLNSKNKAIVITREVSSFLITWCLRQLKSLIKVVSIV